MTSRPDPAKQLASFRKIVAAEANDGFRDGMVTGGLDRFLENIRPNAKNHPAPKVMDELGLLSVDYRNLDLDQRRWGSASNGLFLGSFGRPPTLNLLEQPRPWILHAHPRRLRVGRQQHPDDGCRETSNHATP